MRTMIVFNRNGKFGISASSKNEKRWNDPIEITWILLCAFLLFTTGSRSIAQTASSTNFSTDNQQLRSSPPQSPHAKPRFAAALSIGTQGIGIDGATRLSSRFNLRGGVDLFGYSTTLSTDGIAYNASLAMRSGFASLDWFPLRGSFHISPGVMFYNGTHVNANLNVPVGTAFTLNDTDYYSDPSNPLSGNAKVVFPKAGPRITFGFGNMIPRNRSKHFSVPAEFGFAYFGTGTATLNFSGSACARPDDPGTCELVTQDPSFQSNAQAEQAKIQKNLNYVRFFPILRVGISFAF